MNYETLSAALAAIDPAPTLAAIAELRDRQAEKFEAAQRGRDRILEIDRLIRENGAIDEETARNALLAGEAVPVQSADSLKNERAALWAAIRSLNDEGRGLEDDARLALSIARQSISAATQPVTDALSARARELVDEIAGLRAEAEALHQASEGQAVRELLIALSETLSGAASAGLSPSRQRQPSPALVAALEAGRPAITAFGLRLPGTADAAAA